MRVPLTLSRAAMSSGFVAYKFSRRIRENPHPWFRIAQRIDPVHHSSLGIWIVTSHSAVTAAQRSPGIGRLHTPETPVVRSALLKRIFKQTAPQVREESPFYKLFADSANLFADPVVQPRLKAFLSRTFTPRGLAELRPAIEGFIDPILDEATERGHFEVIGEVADRLPGRAICLLMGIPRSDEHILLDNVPDIRLGLAASPMRKPGDLERADRAAIVVREYVSALVAERRRSPADDLVSALIGVDEADTTKINDVIIATVLALSFAAQTTMATLIGNGVLALLQHPQELARWHDDPSIETTAVEELLRYDPPGVFTVRDAIDDTEVEGRRIPRGSLVALVHAAANHDARAFKDPWKLDLTRSPNPHVSFGGGPHYCIGAPLARLQAGVFFTSFARRFPDARLAPGGVVRQEGMMARALQKLEVLTR